MAEPFCSPPQVSSTSERARSGVVDDGQSLGVRATRQSRPNLGLRRSYAARQHKCRLPKIDERNGPSIGDVPSMSELSGKTRLPPLGNLF